MTLVLVAWCLVLGAGGTNQATSTKHPASSIQPFEITQSPRLGHISQGQHPVP